MNDADRRKELDHWILCLQRFNDRSPLAKSLQQSIESDFNFYQTNNRNQFFDENYSNLRNVPDKVKVEIAVGYLFQDMITTFRRFFNYTQCPMNKQ